MQRVTTACSVDLVLGCVVDNLRLGLVVRYVQFEAVERPRYEDDWTTLIICRATSSSFDYEYNNASCRPYRQIRGCSLDSADCQTENAERPTCTRP